MANMRGKDIFFIACWLGLGSCAARQQQNRQVFYYNEQTGIASLDPAFAKNQSVIWAVHQLFNTLVETDSALQIVPSLAQSWTVSDDRLTYTFHLRTDVWFQPDPAFPGGKRKMTASDVVYSFNRLIDPATASPGAWIFNNRVAAREPFSAPNDSSFVLKLIRPFSPMLQVLSNAYCSIVPREVVHAYGNDFRSHPCGTGPFRFGQWEEGEALILLKNEAYFERDNAGRPLPYLDAVKVTFYDNKATEFLLFRQGELDFVNDIDPSFKDEVLTKKGELKQGWAGKILLQKHPYLNTEYLGILMDTSNKLVQNSPLRFKKIRQAINYGFDRRKMMMYLRNSIGIPAESGFVPAGLPAFDSTAVPGYRYDPEKARRLIREAGYGAGRPIPPVKLLTVAIYSDFGSYIARQLEDLGLHVQVEIVPKSLLLEQTARSTALFFRGSWIADYPDAENFLSVFYGGNPAPPNYTRFSNPQYDTLYRQAMEADSDSARYALYHQMDRLIIADAPVVPLWYDEVIHLVQPTLQGFEANALNLLELRRVRKIGKYGDQP